jgi:prevent-host-death family protein
MCYIEFMSRKITQRELRNNSAEVLRDVQSGQTIIVTRNGTPVAELRPIPARRFVPRALLGNPGPPLDAAQFRADVDFIIDQSVDG